MGQLNILQLLRDMKIKKNSILALFLPGTFKTSDFNRDPRKKGSELILLYDYMFAKISLNLVDIKVSDAP